MEVRNNEYRPYGSKTSQPIKRRRAALI